MKKTIGIVILTLLGFVLFGCEANDDDDEDDPITESTYKNPVWEPILADPSVIRHEGVYYAFGTQDYGQWGEDDYGIKYVPILESSDLVNWRYAGSAFTMATRPTWGTPGAGIWAPDIVRLGETYYLYYSLSTWGDPNPGIGVATAPHPLGPWTDHGELLRSLSIGVNNSIDANVFEADGKVYIIWGSFRGIYGVELTADGRALKDGDHAAENKILIAGLDTSLGWNAATYEAPYVIKKDDFYYLFLSSGSCCEGHSSNYRVSVGRASNPLGPYVDHEGRAMTDAYRGYPVVIGSSFFAGPGHNSIARDDAGAYWLLYHAYDTSDDPFMGNSPRRSLLVDRLVWNEDGWPALQGTMPSNGTRPVPTID
jgi:arabinan endo-1,5-alpha-L-arabinosidase